MIKDIKKEIQEELLNIVRSEFDSLMIFNYVKDLEEKIDKAIEILKDTNVNDNSVLLITTIDYALHILGDKENESN